MVNQQHVRSHIEQVRSRSHGESYVVGVDIGGTSLRVALADSNGSILAKWSASTIGIRDARLVVELIAKGVDDLLQQAAVPRSLLRAAAAGAPGVTDVDAGIVKATSYLMGWQDVPLRALLESALGVATAVDNDVNLGALGELCCGAAHGVEDFVFVALGTGIGAGVVLNGALQRGKGWGAGEIGYMLVPGTSTEPVGTSKPGALESMIGGEGIRNQWNAVWSESATNLPRNLIATEIFSHATNGDLLASRILDQTARVLAYAIYNMALILDFQLFVLGGSVGLHPALCVATQAVLETLSGHESPALMRSTLGADAQLTGAIHFALSMDPVPAVSRQESI